MEIAPGVHSIGPTSAGLFKGGYVHAYLFVKDDELTLVDTFWDDDAHVILDYLWSIGRSPTQLKHIALTHAHRSHLGGLAVLQGLSNAHVYAHWAEAEIIEGTKRARPVSLGYLKPLILYPFRILALVDLPKHIPCEVTVLLEDWGNPNVGPLEVIPTPGHTRGHLSFYHRESNVLCAGDAVATWPTFSAGWPGFNHNEAQYQESLKMLVNMTPSPRIVATGHGDPIKNAGQTCIRALLPPTDEVTGEPAPRGRMRSRHPPAPV